ncbi:hypothetical protein [Sphingobacterium luzhongxinii]|uniref:hypothetical protein n=1 Tax=Sphingobacterium luzhongxinii TaxID=2654181 RepID=UPI0013DB603F|nr:hypothetical protein [Sphingobacterium sp. xlx-73]
MEINIKTSNPDGLKNSITKLIEDKVLDTWSIHTHNDIKYLKHTGQWGEKGVIRLERNATNNELKVKVLKFEGRPEQVEDFAGYYLGRFCEVIFVNFPNSYTSINRV